jgi:hypothetical protein
MPRPLCVLTLCFILSLSAIGQGFQDNFHCRLGHLGTLHFTGSRTKLDRAAKDSLDLIAEKLKDHPNCFVLVQGYALGPENGGDTLVWDRVMAIGDYLIKRQQISAGRFIFRFDSSIENAGILTLDGIDPDGMSAPHPHPKLRVRS